MNDEEITIIVSEEFLKQFDNDLDTDDNVEYCPRTQSYIITNKKSENK